MSRGTKKPNQIRLSPPDPVYGNRQLTKLINRSMRDGKKSTARTQIYRALDIVKDKTKKDPIAVFEEVVTQLTPKMEVRTRRIGGASYSVPTPVRGPRGFSLAMRWLVAEAQKRPNNQYHSFAEKLAAEMLDATNSTGGAFQKKVTAHKMADSNKAFSHFRW